MPKKAQTKPQNVAAKSAPKKSESSTEPVNQVVESVSAKEECEVLLSESPDEKPEVDILGKQFEGVLTTLGTFRQSITALQSQIRILEKQVRKEMKSLRKEASRNKAKGNRKPSGFAKPSVVTPELCKFMGKDVGTEIARTEVTQYLIQYIKDNELQFADNKKIIVPDDTLKSLLGVKEGDEVTYFNLQRLMNQHFVKKSKSEKEESV